jgi:hypothetical protein
MIGRYALEPEMHASCVLRRRKHRTSFQATVEEPLGFFRLKKHKRARAKRVGGGGLQKTPTQKNSNITGHTCSYKVGGFGGGEDDGISRAAIA